MLSYDIFCHLCHMSLMTYDIWHLYHMLIWVSREPSGPQQCSPWLWSHSKVIFMQKKWKNLGIPFPPLKFLKSFVKVIWLVADHFSSYIKNKSSSLIYTYSSMRKLKITIEKSYFCIFDSPYPSALEFRTDTNTSWNASFRTDTDTEIADISRYIG